MDPGGTDRYEAPRPARMRTTLIARWSARGRVATPRQLAGASSRPRGAAEDSLLDDQTRRRRNVASARRVYGRVIEIVRDASQVDGGKHLRPDSGKRDRGGPPLRHPCELRQSSRCGHEWNLPRLGKGVGTRPSVISASSTVIPGTAPRRPSFASPKPPRRHRSLARPGISHRAPHPIAGYRRA